MRIKPYLFVTFLYCLILLPALSFAQKKEKNGSEEDSTKTEKLYHEIITDEAVTMEGLMTVHQIEDKYYLEINDSIFGRDIMAITRMAKTPTGAGYGGEQANRQVVRFEKGPNKNVFIRIVSFVNVSADSLQPIYQAVQNSNVNPIAAAFKIETNRGRESGQDRRATALSVDLVYLCARSIRAKNTTCRLKR